MLHIEKYMQNLLLKLLCGDIFYTVVFHFDGELSIPAHIELSFFVFNLISKFSFKKYSFYIILEVNFHLQLL